MSQPTETVGIEQDLLDFLGRHTKKSWTAETDLFADGGLSSLFALQLVVHLEQAFEVVVDGEHLTLENFRTVRRMADLVTRLRAGDSQA